MAEVGAWRNFDELEEFLTLVELVELDNVAHERQNRLMKTIAAAMGADVGDDEDYADSTPNSSLSEDGRYIPGAIQSAQDAMLLNSHFDGNMLGIEVHNYD